MNVFTLKNGMKQIAHAQTGLKGVETVRRPQDGSLQEQLMGLPGKGIVCASFGELARRILCRQSGRGT